MMKRSMCLYIPALSISRPSGGSSPDPPSAESGAAELKTLAAWAQAFSPIVQIEGADSLLLDVTGCQRLFNGEPNLLDQALSGLAGQGLAARGAIADTPSAAWAIARAHRESAVVTHPGRDLEELVSLPVGALRIDEGMVTTLRAVGVETIEALIYLPRASLPSRFGETLLHRLDQAMGNVAEPLVPFHPPTPLRSHLRLGGATDRQDIIHRAADHVLRQFCEQLAERVAGVARLLVTFYCPEAAATTFTIELSRPTRSFKRLQRLLNTRLEQVRLRAATDAVMIWARHIESLDDAQGELFETEESDAGELTDLIDRLSTRLGSRSVSRAGLLSDHQPERAYEYVPAIHACSPPFTNSAKNGARAVSPSPNRLERGARPIHLLRQPAEIPVMAVVPEGPPTMFRFQSSEHPIVACDGPERLETGWWRGPHIQRDYFRVLTASGQAFWIFRNRDTSQWFLHGMFD